MNNTQLVTMASLSGLRTKLFADGATSDAIVSLASDPRISGFTTNPTLMKQAGILDYETFARELLQALPEHPISFEVFADDLREMRRQATIIASWAPNVYVKIPITNTEGQSCCSLIESLTRDGVKVNVTALMTTTQVDAVSQVLNPAVPACVSVFAGRIADTGRNPMPIMEASLKLLEHLPGAELIWASPRELLNIFQANELGVHIITLTHDQLKKLDVIGKDLEQYSLETVQMFERDARLAGYRL